MYGDRACCNEKEGSRPAPLASPCRLSLPPEGKVFRLVAHQKLYDERIVAAPPSFLKEKATDPRQSKMGRMSGERFVSR